LFENLWEDMKYRRQRKVEVGNLGQLKANQKAKKGVIGQFGAIKGKERRDRAMKGNSRQISARKIF